jgi:hypothetical protein
VGGAHEGVAHHPHSQSRCGYPRDLCHYFPSATSTETSSHGAGPKRSTRPLPSV